MLLGRPATREKCTFFSPQARSLLNWDSGTEPLSDSKAHDMSGNHWPTPCLHDLRQGRQLRPEMDRSPQHHLLPATSKGHQRSATSGPPRQWSYSQRKEKWGLSNSYLGDTWLRGRKHFKWATWLQISQFIHRWHVIYYLKTKNRWLISPRKHYRSCL